MFGPLGRAHLVNVILSSISPTLWYSKDILDKGDFSVPTMNGKLHLVVKDGDVKAGDAFVDKFDVLAMNGVMHGLDTVLESSAKNELLSESDFTESDEFFKQIFY